MVNFGQLAAEICGEFGAPKLISTAFAFWLRYAATSLNGSQPNFARCFAVSWAGTLGALYTLLAALAP